MAKQLHPSIHHPGQDARMASRGQESHESFTFLDHFFEAPLDANKIWVEVHDGGTGANLLQDKHGGWASVVTAASNDDHHAISSPSELWKFQSGKRLLAECLVLCTESGSNEPALWFGLTSDLSTGGFQAGASGPLGTYDGCLWYKAQGGTTWNFETSNASSQKTLAATPAFTSGVAYRLGFAFDPNDGVTGKITPWIDGVAQLAVDIVLSGLEEMHLVLGVKADAASGSVETLEIDYVGVWAEL